MSVSSPGAGASKRGPGPRDDAGDDPGVAGGAPPGAGAGAGGGGGARGSDANAAFVAAHERNALGRHQWMNGRGQGPGGGGGGSGY